MVEGTFVSREGAGGGVAQNQPEPRTDEEKSASSFSLVTYFKADGPLFGFREEEGAGRSVQAARKEGCLRTPPALRMLSCPDLPRP